MMIAHPKTWKFRAGLTAGGMNGEGMFQATALSSLGLAFATGWIAGDNATNPSQTYIPNGMAIESEVAEQRLLNTVNKYFPQLGGFVIKTAFSMKRRKNKQPVIKIQWVRTVRPQKGRIVLL
jgi:hypothetical protein